MGAAIQLIVRRMGRPERIGHRIIIFTSSTGASHPGHRQVRSRQRTNCAVAAEGRYPGSGGLPDGWPRLEPLRSRPPRAPTSAGRIRTQPEDRRDGHWCRRGWPARPTHESPHRLIRQFLRSAAIGQSSDPHWHVSPRLTPAPTSRTHPRGAAPWSADRPRRRWRPTRPASCRTLPHPGRECWPRSPPFPD